jgi:hypothetical protein
MGTITQALNQGDWTQLDLRPESIPHLLHWDLAYLWVLEKPAGLRPVRWQSRVDAWKRLLCLMLVGEIKAVPRTIEPPMLGFTRQYGIDRLYELKYHGQTVGVTSPVVLLRPLPDSERDSLPALPDVHVERRDELRYFLPLLQSQLDKAASHDGERRIQKALLAIVNDLIREWLTGAAGPVESFDSDQMDLILLRSHSFAASADAVDTISVLFSRGKRRRVWVPRCAQCETELTTEDRPENTIDVVSPVVTLKCPSGHQTEIALENLFTLVPEQPASEVTCWTDRDLSPSNERDPYAFPPDVAMNGDGAVKFCWSSGDVGGSGVRRFLRLRFPGRIVKLKSIKHDALYRNLLIPGNDPSQFAGLPVRSEWRNVWSGGSMRLQAGNLEYCAVRISGVPFAVNFLFTGLRMLRQPELAVGIYPKPMFPEWKPYLVFVSGTAAKGYGVKTAGVDHATEVLASSGWPGYVSAESVDGATGATWDLSRCTPKLTARAPNRVCVGVDFGTSNSVLYFQQKDAKTLPRSDLNAASLGDLRSLAHWIEPSTPSPLATKTWLLPDQPAAKQDQYLFPSALWETSADSRRYIRWGNCAPGPDHEARHGFKWDDTARSNHDLRVAYIKSLLFFVLPVALHKLTGRSAPSGIDIGFSYPLAFNYLQREGHRNLLQSVRDWLKDETGLDAEMYSINESLASVRAGGAYNPGEVFLVADMGGRTLDLALFRYETEARRQRKPEALHQIGSLDFGGEAFISAYSSRKSGQRAGDLFDGQYWALRDAIASGTAATKAHEDQTTRDLVNRFHPIAFEFIRTMLAAFRRTAEGANKNVTVLLVGNGWRLRELLAGSQDPVRFSYDHFRHLLNSFGDANIQLRESSIDGIVNSKHWVACGALYAAMHDQSRELQEKEFPSRLPLGRTLRMAQREIEWHELGGESGIDIPDERVIKAGPIDFDFSSGPPLGPDWKETFDYAVPAGERNPRPEMLRNLLLGVIRDNRLAKGPLALILETHWKELLWRDDL